MKDPTAGFQPPATPFQPPANTRIRIRDLPDGVELYLPAARNLGGTAILFGFTAVWSLFLWVMIVKKAPVFFPIIWGLFDALFVFLCALALLHSVRVVATRKGLTVFHRMLVPTLTRRLAVADIRAIVAKPETQAGTKTWYGLTIQTHSGREYSAGGGIPDKQHAEWLARRLAAGLGLGE